MKPIVTVGFCVRNVESTVKEALGSVLDQDFPRELMELIVVDGNSADRTMAIIKDVLSKNIVKHKFFHENEGLGFARQIVVDNAKGDYIVWVDGDLILPKDYVKKLVDFMDRNPIVGIAGGKFGNFPGRTLPANLENIMYVVNSIVQNPKTTSKWLSRESEQHRYVGAEGSIYRVKAIRQVGGFDINIKGAGEDVDVTYRIRKADWRVCKTNVVFYESCKEDWKGLWRQYYWYGYGGHYLVHKDRRLIPIYEMLPPMGFLAGLLNSVIAYEITRKKIFFLLPLQYTFKRIAWCLGFFKAHKDGYGHTQQS